MSRGMPADTLTIMERCAGRYGGKELSMSISLTSISNIAVEEQHAGRVLAVALSGKVSKSDYEAFVPLIEDRLKIHDKLRVLLYLEDFHGWEVSATWEDIKFDAKHFNDFERIAIVGEQRWEQGMAIFCKPFTSAKVRYFDHEQLDEAKAWIAEGL